MMQARCLPRILPVCAVVALAACASPGGEYPSLALRDGEVVTGSMMPASPESYVPARPAAATLDNADSLFQTIRTAHERFSDAVPTARSTINAARGASVGSDAWSNAEVALAGLETQRNDALIAMADLDRIYAEISTDGEAIATIESEYLSATAMIAQQDATLAELLAVLYP